MKTKLIALGLSALILSGCFGSGASEVEKFLGGTGAGLEGAIGDSALTFSPSTWDFGNVSVNSNSSTKSVTIKNSSISDIFIGSLTGTNVNFTLVSNNCPVNTVALAAGSTCEIQTRFNPVAAGKLAMNVTIKYGTSEADNLKYASSMGQSGTGVSPLTFAGITTISNVTTTSLQINWSTNSDATVFQVYQMVSGSMVYVKSVVNTGGTVSNTSVTGLTANTTYIYRVRASDTFGVPDSNVNDVSVTTDAIGTFATGTLTTSEGNTGTLNLNTLCTDTEANTPSSYTLNSQTSTNASPGCSIAANTLSCTPAYKTGHAAWSETANITCSLNGSDITQTVTISVTDTNIAAALTAISNQTGLIAGNAITTVNANAASDTQADGDAYNYLCYYDTTVDAAVASTTACSNLSASAMSYSFTASTGVFDWTPGYSQGNVTYEFKIIADDGTTTASQIFTIQVLPATPVMGHTPSGNLSFPTAYVNQGSNTAADFSNYRTGSASDSGMTYTCYFDTTVDGAVAASNACTTLPGTVATFDTNTGALSFTPNTSAYGFYEIKVTGTNSAGSDSEIIIVDVKLPFSSTNLLSYWDATFANQVRNGVNSTFTSTWKDSWTSSGSYDGTLTGFAETTSSGWGGDGATSVTSGSTGPYRLIFDGTNDRSNMGTGFNSQSSLSLETWVRPSSSSTKNVVIVGNGETAKGMNIKQSALGDSKIQLSIGDKSYADEVLADSPIMYLNFNETKGKKFIDYSGNGNHATITAGTPSVGVSSGALSQNDNKVFTADGATYLTCGTNSMPTAPPITLEAWVYFGSDQGGGDYDYVLQIANFNNDIFAISREASTNKLYTVKSNVLIAGPTVTSTAWHHIVYVFRSSSPYIKMYVDGVDQTGVITQPGSAISPGAAMCEIGRYNGNMHFLNSGSKIDEVAIYNTELLSDRVLAHYNAASNSICRSASALTNNFWTNIFGTFTNGTGVLNLYMNGKNECSYTKAMTMNGGSTSLTTGALADGTKAWSGAMGELRAYSSADSTTVSTNFSATSAKYDQYIPVTNLKLWFRADALGGVSNGTTIGFWPDLSGNNNHAYNSTSSRWPTYTTNVINGQPALNYNAGNNCLVTATGDALTDWSAFIVYKDDGVAQAYERILDKSYTTGFWMGRDNGTANSFGGGVKETGAPYGIYGTSFTDGTAHIYENFRDVSVHYIYKNGTQVATNSPGSTATDTSVYGIGCWGTDSGSQAFGGYIAEVIVYSTYLTTADRQRVERYLGTKYGITVP